jgi:voltage-gated potassium channel
MILTDKVFLYLEDIENPIGRIVNLLITGLVLVSTGIFVAETYPLQPDVRSLLGKIDLIILSIFAVEYLLRLLAAPDKFKYLFSFYSLIDLMAILPVLTGITDVSFVRILRWFRILRSGGWLDRYPDFIYNFLNYFYLFRLDLSSRAFS